MFLQEIKEFKKLVHHGRNLGAGKYHEVINWESFQGNTRIIAMAMENMRVALLQRRFEIEVTSDQLSAIGYELNQSVSKQHDLSAQLAHEVFQMTDMNESLRVIIDSTVQTVAEEKSRGEKIQDISRHVEQSSIASKEEITKQMNEIGKITAVIDKVDLGIQNTQQEIMVLQKSVEDIMNLLGDIEKISSQTRMLSLNASIEAARSQQESKGFSVVANAIRELSNQSEEIVKVVRESLEKLGKSMEEVTKQSHRNQAEVKEAVATSELIQRSLGKITSAYEQVEVQIFEISENAQFMSTGIQGIAQSMELLYGSSQQLGASIELVDASAKVEQEEMTRLLKLQGRLQEATASLQLILDNFEFQIPEEYIAQIHGKAEETKEWFQKEIESNKVLKELNPDKHQEWLHQCIEALPHLEAAWSNDSRGEFVYSYPPAGIANASIRPWFQKCLERKPYISDIYISAISKKPCMTIALPLLGKQQEMVGVIGVDMTVQL